MGAKIQAFDIFQTPLSSHYTLPLMTFYLRKIMEFMVPSKSNNNKNIFYWHLKGP